MSCRWHSPSQSAASFSEINWVMVSNINGKSKSPIVDSVLSTDPSSLETPQISTEDPILKESPIPQIPSQYSQPLSLVFLPRPDPWAHKITISLFLSAFSLHYYIWQRNHHPPRGHSTLHIILKTDPSIHGYDTKTNLSSPATKIYDFAPNPLDVAIFGDNPNETHQQAPLPSDLDPSPHQPSNKPTHLFCPSHTVGSCPFSLDETLPSTSRPHSQPTISPTTHLPLKPSRHGQYPDSLR